jgi:phenylacetate-CoA ligase
MLADSAWPLAKLVLGASIIDYYGQAERVAFAYAARAGEYFFLPGYASVELIPAHQDESGHCYEIVGTSLWNTAMPLVRYRTGDLIRLPQEPTQQALLEIAHGLRSFPGVIGRSADVLLAPDGKGVLTGIDHIPRGVRSLLRLQVIQDAVDEVELRALVTDEFNEQDAEQLMRNARLKIPQSVHVRWMKVEQLRRTENGKTPFVIHAPQIKEALQSAGISSVRM